MTKLFLDAGVITLTAFISPFRSDRAMVRSLMPAGDVLEIFCDCPLEVCEERDVKDLYKKARAGIIGEFTGISSPYEEPEEPELVLNTSELSLGECVDKVIVLLVLRGVVEAEVVKIPVLEAAVHCSG